MKNLLLLQNLLQSPCQSLALQPFKAPSSCRAYWSNCCASKTVTSLLLIQLQVRCQTHRTLCCLIIFVISYIQSIVTISVIHNTDNNKEKSKKGCMLHLNLSPWTYIRGDWLSIQSVRCFRKSAQLSRPYREEKADDITSWSNKSAN